MNAVATVQPAQGWRARLELQFQRQRHCTRLTHRLHSGPLMVQRAFYPEGACGDDAPYGEPCHVYVLHPPGGVVSGDELALEVQVGSQGHAVLTTPAAGKFYRRHETRTARLTQTFQVEGGALEWLPQENIYYPDAAAELNTIVRLSGGARFVGWELGCLGLPANQCTIGNGHVRQCFELWHDGAPRLLERLSIDHPSLQARWGMAGYLSLGTLIAFPADPQLLECARAAVTDGAPDCAERILACTLVDDTLCCRGCAVRADRLKQGFIDIWSALRPKLLGRAAMPPRIWMT